MVDMGDATSEIDDTAEKPYATQAELKASLTALREQCEASWREVAALQHEVKGRDPEPTPSSETSLVSVYQAKAALLRAQVKVTKSTEPRVTLQDPLVQFEQLKRELEASVSQLSETLTLVRSEKTELETARAQEELFKREKQQVKAVLEAKVAQSEAEAGHDDGNAQSNALLKDTEAKTAKMKKYNRSLMKKMALFIQENFPEPTDEQIEAWRRKHCRTSSVVSSAKDSVPFLSLLTIIEHLMNLLIDSPNDCYLEVTEAFWPPYVELLLRSGIVLRNPNRHNYIRLMPFHI